MPEIPKSKTLGFIFLGIILYLGSSYLNILKSDSAILGISLAILLIAFGILAQIINWARFWNS